MTAGALLPPPGACKPSIILEPAAHRLPPTLLVASSISPPSPSPHLSAPVSYLETVCSGSLQRREGQQVNELHWQQHPHPAAGASSTPAYPLGNTSSDLQCIESACPTALLLAEAHKNRATRSGSWLFRGREAFQRTVHSCDAVRPRLQVCRRSGARKGCLCAQRNKTGGSEDVLLRHVAGS